MRRVARRRHRHSERVARALCPVGRALLPTTRPSSPHERPARRRFSPRRRRDFASSGCARRLAICYGRPFCLLEDQWSSPAQVARFPPTRGYATGKAGQDLTREMKDLEHSLDRKMKDLEHGLSTKLASTKSSFESYKHVTKGLCTNADIELTRYSLGAAYVVTAVLAWPFLSEKTK